MAFLLEFIHSVQGSLVVAVALAVPTGVLFEGLNRKLIKQIARQAWWPRSMTLQASICRDSGYPESQLTSEMLADLFAFVLIVCAHHLAAGVMTIPVVVLGWAEAGPWGQLSFLLACLGDVSLALFDTLKKMAQMFMPSFAARIFTGSCPLKIFIIVCILHHPLAILMVVPMCAHYPSLPAFHYIACSLLFGAGICYLTGQYKYTLDTSSKAGLIQYKCIVVLQLVTIVLTRGIIWFTQTFSALTTFYDNGDMLLVAGSGAAAGLFSLFNLLMIADAAHAACKWLPKTLHAAAGPQAPNPVLLRSYAGHAFKELVRSHVD